MILSNNKYVQNYDINVCCDIIDPLFLLINLYIEYIFFFLATTEFETQRKHYSKVSDAYGCLGVLRIPVGKHHFLYNYYFKLGIYGCYITISNL